MIITGAMPTRKTEPRRGRARLEQVASCPLGQILFRGADRLLWTVETSVQWFVESKEPHKNESSPGEMPRSQPVRPLPWALFLPLLVWLRLAKFAVELVASLRGTEPLRPLQVVHFLRVRRRRLRALKYHGLKNFQSWQQAEKRNRRTENECMVLKLLSVGPLGTLLVFTGLGQVLSSLRGTMSTQTGQRKTVAEDSESSDDMEDLLEKINRICHDYTSDEDPDYEPNDEEEDSDDSLSSEDNGNKTTIAVGQDTGSDTNSQTIAVADINSKIIVPTLESNILVISTSQDDKRREAAVTSNDANYKAIVTTSNAAGQQAKAETIDSNTQTVIATNPAEAKATDDDNAKHQNEELDDSSSTLSQDSTEGCSESTSQTFYSPISSSCVTPEPKATGPAMTQKSQPRQSAETHPVPPGAEANTMKPSDSLVSLLASRKSSDGSIISGSNLSLKDLEEDTKGKSKFSNIFQIKKKFRSQKT